MASKNKEEEDSTSKIYSDAWKDITKDMNIKIANVLKNTDTAVCILLFLVVFIILIILIFFMYQLDIQTKKLNINNILDVWNNPKLINDILSNDTDEFYAQCKSVFITIFALFVSILAILMLNNRKNSKMILGVMMGIFVLLSFAIFFYNNSEFTSSKIYTYIVNKFFIVIMILIAIVTLALVYKLFANRLRNQPGIIGFIIDFIFYIPCLFSDILEFGMKQIYMTPNSVFVLFIIEILLIIAYVSIPATVANIITSNSIPIMSSYQFLNHQTILPTDKLPIISITDSNTNLVSKTPNRKYAISAWVYLNQQTHNNSDTSTKNIFSYGSQANGMKPQINYSNSASNQYMKDIYEIIFSGDTDQSNTMFLELTSQKWNHFLFNYNTDTTNVELYVNGDLARVYNFNKTNPYPVYDFSDVFSIGDKNGLDGAICNVAYYNDVLSSSQVHALYMFLSVKNPPVM